MELSEKQFCRLCAEEKATEKLNDIQDILPKLLRLNQPFLIIEDMNLPQSACLVCIRNLDLSVQFIDSVEKAQTTLNQLLQKEYAVDDIKNDDSDQWPPPLEFELTFNDPNAEEESIKNKKATSKKVKRTRKPKKSVNKRKKRVNSSTEDSDDQSLAAAAIENVKTWSKLNWQCSVCDNQFPSQKELVSHSMGTHNNCSTYKCLGCNRKFLKLDTYIFHLRKFHCKKLRSACHICDKVFDLTKHRIEHQKRSHKDKEFSCIGCVTTFATKQDLDNHLISYYQDGRALRYIGGPDTIKAEPHCGICNITFDSRSALRKHLYNTHRPQEPNICDKCGKIFANKANLSNHLMVHSNLKLHKCTLCPQEFRSASNLKEHMIRHKGEKNHSCTECGKTFLFKNQLKTHTSVHSNSFPFKCQYCVKCFRLNAQLKRHLRQHTGYKPYKCKICEREFTDWPNYNKHSVRKHNIDTSKTKRTPYGVIRLSSCQDRSETGGVVAPGASPDNGTSGSSNVKVESQSNFN